MNQAKAPMHTRPVQLCPECEQGLYRTAERATTAVEAMYCPHNRALAVVGLESHGAIKYWSTEGPLSLDQAAIIIGEAHRQALATIDRVTGKCPPQ